MSDCITSRFRNQRENHHKHIRHPRFLIQKQLPNSEAERSPCHLLVCTACRSRLAQSFFHRSRLMEPIRVHKSPSNPGVILLKTCLADLYNCLDAKSRELHAKLIKD
jgi:hypothetical protein